MGQPHRKGLGFWESQLTRKNMEQLRRKSPALLGKGWGFGSTTDRATYPQKPLQELPGAVDVDAGDVAVAPQHAIHRGGYVLPVLLCLGIKLELVLHHLARHAGRGAHAHAGLAAPPTQEKPPVRSERAVSAKSPPNGGGGSSASTPISIYHPFSPPQGYFKP